MITPSEIDHLANLARIEVKSKEAEDLSKDISAILDYVGKVKEVAKMAPEGTDNGLGPVDVLREDINPIVRNSETEKLIKSAPESQDGFIKVQKVL